MGNRYSGDQLERNHGSHELFSHTVCENEAADILSFLLEQHRKIILPYTSVLIDAGKRDGMAGVFDHFRANYFFRTMSTLPSLRKLLNSCRSQRPQNERVTELVLSIVLEESGTDPVGISHPEMLERSFNLHGAMAFGLPTLNAKDVDQSPFILPEARSYRAVQHDIYESSNHAKIVGAFAAQELVANDMLDAIFRGLFLPYLDGLAGREEIEMYFRAHLDGLELEHGDRALECAHLAVRTPQQLEEFLAGAKSFLGAQAALWGRLGTRFGH